MLKVFISYSHKDHDFLDELNAQLATLRNLQLIETWTDKEIQPGVEWEVDIWTQFNAADIIILLISADFLNSQFCYTKEFAAADARRQRGEARIIPVIVRSCDWKDGRLDTLQCLCADKPVALYGKDRTDRDPAWTLVATEVRKVVAKFSTTPVSKKAAMPGGNDDAEDSEGELVPLLCDRQVQEEGIFERFFAAATGAPQIYFLPGREDAVHDSFVKRVQCNIVPRLLGEEYETLRHLTQMILGDWIEKLPSGRELPFLISKLTSKIDVKLKPDATLIKKHPKFAGNIILIQHRLYARFWNDKTPGLLRDYITFWSKAADEADRPMFLIFFNVIFAESCNPDGPELKALAALAEELDGHPCGVGLLDPLGGVEWEHVDAWLSTYLPRRRMNSDRLRRSLFATPEAKPMQEIEPALREFAEQD